MAIKIPSFFKKAVPAGGKDTPIAQSTVNLVANGLLHTVQGVTGNTWFGPGQPLAPVAPPGTEVRIRDYPYAINMDMSPRVSESTGITFAQLRELAKAWDLLSLVIETRKDQVVAVPWAFRLRSKDGESKKGQKERTKVDPRIQALNRFFHYPDEEHDWDTWIRALLDEVFITDALSIAPGYTIGGGIHCLDIIDGATITRKIDVRGKTPKAPSVAYQQIIKGLPAIDLSTRDLLYKPRNHKAHRTYGFSPVEQIVLTTNMALRRNYTQLSNFTEGTLPEALATVPDKWSPSQIDNFQAHFDSFAGDLAQKSRIRFVPNLDKIVFTKEKMLVDEFDEWLARLVCFAFSISPQPFIKMMNRATAQSAQDQATQEGLIPLLKYVSSVLTYIVDLYLGYDDIEHVFLSDEEADKLKQAQIDKIYVSYGKDSVDEQRVRDGQEPYGIGPMVITPNGMFPLKPYMDGGSLAEGTPEQLGLTAPKSVPTQSAEPEESEKDNNDASRERI